jgi:hypothetical protein
VPEPTIIAVDWSGARRPRGIWAAVVRDGELVESRPFATRESAIAFVADTPTPVIAGFDFSFSVPAWFAAELGCAAVADVWDRAAKDGEAWLAPTPPFWRARNELPLDRRFRRCEERFPTAKSIFQLVGNGQVGAGSVRGMPLLRDLRAAGFAIWPFDAPGPSTAFEIYPSVLRTRVAVPGPFRSNDERDAVCAALAMWPARASVAALAAATDPIIRLEGDVWMPPEPAIASPSTAR